MPAATDAPVHPVLSAPVSGLRSPEELDRLVTTTTPLGWFALATVGFLAVVALIWGLVGSIPTTVSGSGILLRGGRIASVPALGSGKVLRLEVALGARVKAGDVVGAIQQPTLESQITGQRETAAKLAENAARVTASQTKNLQEELAFLAKQRESTKASIASYKQLATSLAGIVKSQNELMQKGLIPATSYISTQSQLSQTQMSLLSAENQLKKIDSDETSSRMAADQAIFEAESQLMQARSSLAELESQLAETSKLVASNDGEVIGIVALPGQAISTGAPVLSIEAMDESMRALVYLTSGLGKRVRPGMEMQISPATAEVYDYGYVRARVLTVSEAPASQEAMMSVLGSNQRLVETFTAGGAPVAVEAELELDPATKSGFLWSSSKGPPFAIRSGTLCTARAITQQQAPITLVIPLLKEFLGIRS